MELAIKIIIDAVRQNGIAGDRIDFVLNHLIDNASIINDNYEKQAN